MRIVLLTCVLGAVACGGADTPPATDPSSVSAASSATTTSAPANPSDPGPPPAPASPSGVSTADPQPADPGVAASQAPVGTTPNSATSSPQAGAAVMNDSGAHDQTKNADNTKINARDRHGALTPMSQGNSSDETKITAAIRRGLMGDKSLSFTAKNVKIITTGTKVTLRGPVKSDGEKAAIEAHAIQTPGVTDVDDQLEVKK
jgi:hyperosmotically inducible periplasmic protein